jgi:hypothetical protein
MCFSEYALHRHHEHCTFHNDRNWKQLYLPLGYLRPGHIPCLLRCKRLLSQGETTIGLLFQLACEVLEFGFALRFFCYRSRSIGKHSNLHDSRKHRRAQTNFQMFPQRLVSRRGMLLCTVQNQRIGRQTLIQRGGLGYSIIFGLCLFYQELVQ